MRTTRLLAAATAVALAATSAGVLTAADAAAPKPKPLATGLVSPLSAAVAPDGTAYVTQNFAGLLTRVQPGKKPKIIYASKGGKEVGGVSERNGVVVFTETASNEQGEPSDSWVKQIGKSGKVRTIAHVRAFENKVNPDGVVEYGARGISADCAAAWPTEDMGPATYDGLPDSHPYATYQTKKKVYVADAGMNAVVAISGSGRISTLAVLPAVAVPITGELAAMLKLPDCAVGLTYYGESVPTDVELGPDGKLYVTTEGGGLGEQMPLGSIYRVDPGTGKTKKVVGGLLTPVGLGVTDSGDFLVSQLFAGVISKVKHGTTKVRTYSKVNLPGAVEWTPKGVYATVDSLVGPSEESPDTPPGGRLVKYRG